MDILVEWIKIMRESLCQKNHLGKDNTKGGDKSWSQA